MCHVMCSTVTDITETRGRKVRMGGEGRGWETGG